MDDERYTFLLKIEGVHPYEMPLPRLLKYLKAATEMLGVGENMHLVDIKDASTGAALLIDAVQRNDAERNVTAVLRGDASKSVMRAYEELQRLAYNDNLPVRLVRPNGEEVLRFEPPSVPLEEEIGPLKQEGFLQGHVVSVGGRDDTKHVQLQDGDQRYTGIETSAELASQLGHHLFIPVVRLSGVGTWYRRPGVGWCLDRFQAASFEVLDDRPLLEVIHDLRSLDASDWSRDPDPWGRLNGLRADA